MLSGNIELSVINQNTLSSMKVGETVTVGVVCNSRGNGYPIEENRTPIGIFWRTSKKGGASGAPLYR